MGEHTSEYSAMLCITVSLVTTVKTQIAVILSPPPTKCKKTHKGNTF